MNGKSCKMKLKNCFVWNDTISPHSNDSNKMILMQTKILKVTISNIFDEILALCGQYTNHSFMIKIQSLIQAYRHLNYILQKYKYDMPSKVSLAIYTSKKLNE